MSQASSGNRLCARDLLVLGLLWIGPAFGLRRASLMFDVWFFIGWAAAISVVTYFVYARDKASARAGAWRYRERTLHLLSLLGGWSGAYLAQRAFRHKTSKRSFLFTFWLIVAAYQFVAIDYALRWRLTHAAVRLLR